MVNLFLYISYKGAATAKTNLIFHFIYCPRKAKWDIGLFLLIFSSIQEKQQFLSFSSIILDLIIGQVYTENVLHLPYCLPEILHRQYNSKRWFSPSCDSKYAKYSTVVHNFLAISELAESVRADRVQTHADWKRCTFLLSVRPGGLLIWGMLQSHIFTSSCCHALFW